MESVRKDIEINDIVQTIFLDLSKAFDSISHDILKKPKIVSFDSDAANFTKMFPSNRIQHVNLY